MIARDLAGIAIAAAFLGLFLAAVVQGGFPAPAIPAGQGVGTALWEGRTLEVLLQAAILLAGVIAILLLLGREASPGVRR
jgi:hypothetical protein